MSIPTSIGSGEFRLFGVTLRCHVLDDGRRVIEADDLRMLFEAMARDDATFDAAELERFARWQRGSTESSA